MLFCTKCGTQLNANETFCRNCGAPVPAQNMAAPAPVEPTYAPPAEPTYAPPAEPTYAPPAYTPPAYTPPTYTPPAYTPPVENTYAPPVYQAEPVVAPKAKALGFVAMGLGIGGLALAVIGLLYTLMGMDLDAMGFGMSVGFGIFSIPCSILGKVFCNKAQEAGNVSTPPSVGSKLGLAGIIVSGVMVFFGFISLMIA